MADTVEKKTEIASKTFWAENTLHKITTKTAAYATREKKNIRLSFLINAIEKVSKKEEVEAKDWNKFQEKVTEVIELLPEKSRDEKLSYGKSLKAITNFKTYVLKNFNYVSKGFYLKIWMVVGIIFGLILGAIFGYLLPGILLGIGIGLFAGSLQDKKAAVNNRVL